MQLSGTGAGFDSQLLQTDAAGLGIRLLKNGDVQPLNQWFDIDPDHPPQLEAVLVKQAGATFQNGQAFTAGATLKVAYN
jgi:type 1 fimbria pilin